MCNVTDGDTAVQSAYDTEFADTTSVTPNAAAAAEMYSTNRIAYLKHKAASHGTAKGAIMPIVIAAATQHGSNSSSCADSVHDDGKQSLTLLYIAVMLAIHSLRQHCCMISYWCDRALLHRRTVLYRIFSCLYLE
jgi:hypothetical protein